MPAIPNQSEINVIAKNRQFNTHNKKSYYYKINIFTILSLNSIAYWLKITSKTIISFSCKNELNFQIFDDLSEMHVLEIILGIGF